MLIHLQVQDLAVVDNVTLEPGPGVTVLTGETGAGKSLLVDALELVVGARASADMVRAGAPAAHLTAVFEPPPAVAEWLAEHDLEDEDGACVLRRVIGADGRSRAWINARAVPVSQLRDLGEWLVDVHGQHAQRALLRSGAQRELLDSFLGDRGALEAVASAHAELVRLDEEIASLAGDGEEPLARLDYLRFQLDELSAAPVAPDEIEAIESEHRRLANVAELSAAVSAVRTALDRESEGAAGRLGDALHALDDAAHIDPRLEQVQQSLRECDALLADADASLRRYADSLEADDGRLAELDELLSRIHDLARKHRVPEHALHERRLSLEKETRRIEASAERLRIAARERVAALERFADAAGRLHAGREIAAAALAGQVEGILAGLGMTGAAIRFDVRHDAEAAPARHGRDRITLLARTNPGQGFLPLARVASGGELSRIALAVHVVALDSGGASTVVFDEVDAGVGGAVAEILGRRMRELGEHRQVLTVTHLPQVAAFAHHHAVVRKDTAAGGARSRLFALEGEEREQELARMLGGVTVTRRTLEHAREMLASANAAPTARGAPGPRRGAA